MTLEILWTPTSRSARIWGLLHQGALGIRIYVVIGFVHITRRCLGVLATSLLLFSIATGCAAWDAERWNLDHYRDERTADIEQHLSREKPIVENPFSESR